MKVLFALITAFATWAFVSDQAKADTAKDKEVRANLFSKHQWVFFQSPWQNYAAEYGQGTLATKEEKPDWCAIYGYTTDGTDQFPTIRHGALAQLKETTINGLFIQRYETLQIVDSMLEELAELKQLEYLAIVGVPLPAETVGRLAQLPRLKRLLLSDTGLGMHHVARALGSKSGLVQLTVVNAFHPSNTEKLTANDIELIVTQFPNLEELHVRGATHCDVAALASLARLRKLKSLKLGGMPMPPSGRGIPGASETDAQRTEHFAAAQRNLSKYVSDTLPKNCEATVELACIDLPPVSILWPVHPTIVALLGEERAAIVTKHVQELANESFELRQRAGEELRKEALSWGRDAAYQFCRAVECCSLTTDKEAAKRVAAVAEEVARGFFETQLTRYNETHDDVDALGACLMPDGKIVYCCDRARDGQDDLWLLDIKTGKSEQLTFEANAFGPTVLPDGRLVYAKGEFPQELWLFDPAAKAHKQLTKRDAPHADVGARHPAALPDGRIVYSSSRAGKANWELWLMDLPGDRHYRLTHFNQGAKGVYVMPSSGSPAPLPD